MYHFLQYGLIRIAFDIHDKNTSTVSHIFSQWPIFLKGLAVSILYYLMVLGGLSLVCNTRALFQQLFFVSPFIFLSTTIVVLFDAFKESARLTYGSRKHIFGLIFILLVLKHVLMGATGLGYIIFWPIGMLAMVYLYRKLQKNVTIAYA